MQPFNLEQSEIYGAAVRCSVAHLTCCSSEKNKMKKKLLGLFAVLCLAAGASYAQVQAGLGALAGIVTDNTNASVSGAKVVLTNPGIGLRKETTTNSAGEFTFSPLTVVGGYNITVTAKGFSTGSVKDITTSVGTVITQNVALAVGSESQTVEVSAGSIEQVQTDTSSVSQLIDSTIFQDAPLSVRNQNTFVGLVAGAAPDTANTGRGYAVNGSRTGSGNFLLDGFDNNDQGLGGGAQGGAVTTISPDAIQEYRVITSDPDAEYGRAGGFTTDTVVKSGTNHWHGSAFGYNRIQALAQNNWFSNYQGLRDHLVRNQFGGSIGGPIVKDRTFFYATLELQRKVTANPATFTGITQDFYNFVKSGAYETFMEGTTQQNPAANPNGDGTVGTGFCPQYLGTTCPGAFAGVKTLGPVFNTNYSQTPGEFPFATYNFTNEPTDLLLGGSTYLPVNIYGTGNVLSAETFKQNRGTMKIDHRLTGRDQLSFVYTLDPDSDVVSTGGGDAFPGPAELNYGGAQLFGATWIHTFTPNLLNTFKAGYLRHVRNFAATGPQGTASTLSADSITTGFGKSSGFPQLFTENQFTYEDSLTFTHGRHTAKGGFRFARTRNGSSFYNDVNGTYYYWGAADELTDGQNAAIGEALTPTIYTPSTYGTLYYASASLDLTTLLAPNPYRGYRANEFAAYAEDSWKATSRLNLNYGLRWDYFGPPHNSVPGIDSNVYFGTDTSVRATLNPFAPSTPILIGEQGAAFECVAVACGTPTVPLGYAPSNGKSTIWNRDLNNFAPRVGFAEDAFGNGKLVIRGGFGVGFDRLYNNVYENIRFNGPHFVDNATGFGAGSAGILPALATQLIHVPFNANTALVGNGSPVPRHVDQNLRTAYYEQAHLGVETQKAGYVFEANYIGTFGRQLVGLMNANTFEGRTACVSSTQQAACKAAGITNFSSARPNSSFANDNFRTNGFGSNFNGGQLSVRKGYSHGLQVLLNYSYGKALDEISDVFTVKGGATGTTTPYNRHASYGPADFDVRHNAVFTVNYVSQSQSHKLLYAGWGISPIVTMRSGATVNVYNSSGSYDPNQDGATGVQRALYIGGGNPKNAYNHSVSPAGLAGTGTESMLNINDFTHNSPKYALLCPANVNHGLFCDVGGRNSLYGLRQYNVDMAISKHIPLGERFNLTLQAAFFDVDGHVEWSDPVGDVNSPSFGKSTSTPNGGREGQLSGRIDF
jgi:hypothetical protein